MSAIVCISRHSPYGSSLARDALDAVLAASAFEQDIALLLMDEGVWQAYRHQQASAIEQKELGKNLSALAVFGVEKVYVHERSLTRRGLDRDSLSLNNVQLLNDEATRALLAQARQVLSF